MRKWCICFMIFMILAFPKPVSAAEEELDYDSLSQVESVLEEQDEDFSFAQIVKLLMTGNVKGALQSLWEKCTGNFVSSFVLQKEFLKQMMIAAVIAAVFKNLSDAFLQGNAGSAGFYVTYMVFIALMTDSFYYLNETAQDLIQLIMDYIKGMITAYSTAVVSTSGVTTSTAVYEFYLMVIYGMSLLTDYLILPMIRILFVLKIVNHISEEEHFSRLCSTLEKAAGWLMKGFLSLVLGVQMIQSMILPAVDSLKNTALEKGISSIPGIGGGLNTVMTTVIGSAVVIKNSIGAAGILILLVLVLPPLLKIGTVVLAYIAAGILLQPVSDKRITGAIDAVIKSGKLMMQMIIMMTVLFILSIALIAFSTNVNYYAG